MEELVIVGKVINFFGIKGELKVKSDLGLTENEYILEELIGATVVDGNENIGKVLEIYTSSNMNYIKVEYGNKTYLIPLIDEYIDHFNRDTKTIYTNNGKSLCL